jgi:uncharacterized membrane protein
MTPRPAKAGSGFEPHLAAAIAYAGGAITGIVMLVLEKQDRFVRFHAMQSTVAFLSIAVLHFILLGVPLIGRALYGPFIVGVALLWVFLIVNAFQGKMYKLPYIGDFAEQQIGA